MTKIPEVELPPINKKIITVGLITDDYEIGGTRRGKQIVNVYDFRIVEYIAELAKKRVNRKFDCPICISGPRRTGKSTSAIAIARQLNPDFTTDQIVFRLDDFIDVLNKLPHADPEKGIYPVAVLDESGVDLYSKEWQKKLVKHMVKIFQIIGMKRITMILCLPHRNLLTKDIRESMYLWITTQEDIEGERGFAELREGIYNKWEMSLFWKPICGFCYDPLDDDFWKTYEEKKRSFIDSFLKEKDKAKTGPSAYEYRLRSQRDEAIAAAYRLTKLPYKKIAKEIGSTVAIVQNACQKRKRDEKGRLELYSHRNFKNTIE